MFKSIRTYWLVIAVVIALMAGGMDRASATSLTIANWNFEADNPLANGTWAVPTITGWTKSGAGGTFYGEKATNPDEYFLTLPDSGRVAYTNVGSITQTLNPLIDPLNGLNAGHLYTLTVDVGNRYQNFTTGRGFPNYSIELLAGGTPLNIETVFMPTPNYGYFSTATLTYLASSNNILIGQDLGIRLTSYGAQVNWDNVTLTNNLVPEPATLLLLGSGLLGAAWFGKKKFKA